MVIDAVGPENSNLSWQYGHLVVISSSLVVKKRQGQEHFNKRLFL
jgi:hypothetical protein